MLSPEITAEDQLKQSQLLSACSQPAPYCFYTQQQAHFQPAVPQNFWAGSG